jgi:hypothetical protein
MTRHRDKGDPQGCDTTDANVTSPVEEWCPFRKGCEDGESWCSWPCDKWFEWHDAQVAAKVLDELYGNLVLEWNRFDGDDPYEFYETVKNLIETLRQREQPK